MYKNYCRIFNALKRAAKANYYIDILNKHKNDITNTWTILRQALSKQKGFRKLPHSFVINGKQTSCPEYIAEELNNFFFEIGESLGNSIHFHNYLTGHYPTNFFMRPTDALEVIATTNTLNKKGVLDLITFQLLPFAVE